MSINSLSSSLLSVLRVVGLGFAPVILSTEISQFPPRPVKGFLVYRTAEPSQFVSELFPGLRDFCFVAVTDGKNGLTFGGVMIPGMGVLLFGCHRE